MAYLSDWTQGTLTVTNGSAAVTGVGTVWNGAGLAEGDLIFVNGLTGVILTVNSATSITLDKPWPGTTAAGVTYRARYQSDGSRYTAVAKQVLQDLQAGNVSAIAGLVGTANSLPMFTGPGAMSLLATGTVGRAGLAAATADAFATAVGGVRNGGGTNMGTNQARFGWHTDGTSGLIGQVDALSLGKIYNTYYAVNLGGAPTIRSEIGAFSTSGGTISGSVTSTGNIWAQGGMQAGTLQLIGVAGTDTGVFYDVGSVGGSTSRRWAVYRAGFGVGEPGSNQGSDLRYNRHDDAGSFLGAPLIINRRYGIVMTNENPMCFAIPTSNSPSTTTLTPGQHYGWLGASTGFTYLRGASNALFTIGGNPGVGGRALHVPLTGLYRIFCTMTASVAGTIVSIALNGVAFRHFRVPDANWTTMHVTLLVSFNANDYLSIIGASGSPVILNNECAIVVELISL